MSIKITAEPKEVFAGQTVKLTLKDVPTDKKDPILKFYPTANHKGKEGTKQHGYSSIPSKNDDGLYVARWDTTGIPPTWYEIEVHFTDSVVTSDSTEITFASGSDTSITVKHALTNTVISKSHAPQPTDDQALWAAIRNRTQAIGFDRYATFINNIFCNGSNQMPKQEEVGNYYDYRVQEPNPQGGISEQQQRNINLLKKVNMEKAALSINAADSYSVLRLATQVFLLLESGVHLNLKDKNGLDYLFKEDQERIRLDDPGAAFTTVSTKLEQYLDGTQGKLPYLYRILEALLGPYNNDIWAEKLAYCNRILQYRFSCPSMLELIWSYWHEEAMLVQSMNAMTLRFPAPRRF